ncbi:hypothetical protein [Nocardia sp. NPDC048505]|uniref:hypothetical protein n=1 Tax=unclassified Nocardia TaxID=2637762 RepID=UPI0033FE5888
MKRSFAAATLAGALLLTPMAAAQAAPAVAAPVATKWCSNWPGGNPVPCTPFLLLLEALSAGSASLSAES